MTGMDELGPEARALLDAAREGLSPDPAAVRRVHGRIHAAATGAAAGTALGIKLGVAGLVAALAIGGALYLRHGWSASPASPPSLALASPVERPERAAAHESAPADDDLITIEPTGAPTSPRVAPASPAAASPRGSAAGDAHRVAVAPGHRGALHGAARPTAGSPAGIDLAREVALIDLAMAALRRDDAAAALRAVQEYAVEAGDTGQLRQDAAAIEVEALCKLGDPAARDRRAAFDARFPHSAQRARLEAACR